MTCDLLLRYVWCVWYYITLSNSMDMRTRLLGSHVPSSWPGRFASADHPPKIQSTFWALILRPAMSRKAQPCMLACFAVIQTMIGEGGQDRRD
jgi:hypothetical protein